MLKLNYRRTFLIGLAFFSICAFWQMYDAIIPLILRDTYGVKDGPAGLLMALDNIFALFLLPFFGALSDKKGLRMPFILSGTLAAAILMMCLPVAANLAAAGVKDNLFLFILLLGLLLIVMGAYRSPAVALMADVTPKPLRSQGNAVINLMGAFGGLYALLMIKLAVRPLADGREDYFFLFLAVALLMLASVLVLSLCVREKKLVEEMKAINYGVSREEDQSRTVREGGSERLPPAVRRSLLLILSCIALWFMGYNALTTAFSKYATALWDGGLSHASTCLMVATVAAVLSYMPIGMLSARFGRRKVIILGLAVAALAFLAGALWASSFHPALYLIFISVGFAQAAVTVNTFPMVWELSRAGNVGKYTGYYYTCSMAAQTLTPILSGYLLQWFGYGTLFPYGALMVGAAIVPICLSRHGDTLAARKKGLAQFEAGDD